MVFFNGANYGNIPLGKARLGFLGGAEKSRYAVQLATGKAASILNTHRLVVPSDFVLFDLAEHTMAIRLVFSPALDSDCTLDDPRTIKCRF